MPRPRKGWACPNTRSLFGRASGVGPLQGPRRFAGSRLHACRPGSASLRSFGPRRGSTTPRPPHPSRFPAADACSSLPRTRKSHVSLNAFSRDLRSRASRGSGTRSLLRPGRGWNSKQAADASGGSALYGCVPWNRRVGLRPGIDPDIMPGSVMIQEAAVQRRCFSSALRFMPSRGQAS